MIRYPATVAVCCAVLLSSRQLPAAITVATVPVGDPGNPNDPATGNLYGGVSYNFSIGTYEVTVGQYTVFLNAVAASDTYGLYNTSMATDAHIAGIARSGLAGSYSYTILGSANHPIAYVSWGDAARFANWKNNGQPTGLENSSTTERGAYALNGAVTATDLKFGHAKRHRYLFLPSENEWYKAAYYQTASHGGDVDNYWTFPMRTNSFPYSDQPLGNTPNDTSVGNFYKDDGAVDGYDGGYAVTGSSALNPNTNYLTDAGAYASSPGPWGTFDQAGNVWEWDEATIGASRGLRGGSWAFDDFYVTPDMAASERFAKDPTLETFDVGFRLARVPEPGTVVLAFVGILIGGSTYRGIPHRCA